MTKNFVMCLYTKLPRATATPTWFEQNNTLTNTVLITVLITYQLITCDSFHPFWKQNFRAALRNMAENGCAEMCTSGIHVAARFITLHQFWTLVGMNPLWWIILWKKWLRLEYLLWCCRHLSAAQKKANTLMHPEISFCTCNPQRSHMKPSCH